MHIQSKIKRIMQDINNLNLEQIDENENNLENKIEKEK